MKRRIALVLVVAMTFVPMTFAQERISIAHDALTCIPDDCGRAVVTATVRGTVMVQSVRLLFHAGEGPDYWIEMLHAGDWEYWAVLPAVQDETTVVSYRVVATGADGTQVSSREFSAPVADTCPAPELTPDQTAYAFNTALGMTAAGQPAVPPGFKCTGIVNEITVDGEVMRVHTACEEWRVAENDPCALVAAVAPAGVPLGRAAALAAAGAAAAIGGAILYDENRGDDEPVSPSRPLP